MGHEGKPPFSYGFPMVFLWFSYGFPMLFPWFAISQGTLRVCCHSPLPASSLHGSEKSPKIWSSELSNLPRVVGFKQQIGRDFTKTIHKIIHKILGLYNNSGYIWLYDGIYIYIWLLVYLPLWKIWVRQWEGWHPIYEMENKKCSKPPTRKGFHKDNQFSLYTLGLHSHQAFCPVLYMGFHVA